MKDAKAIVHVAILVVVYLFANCSVFDEKINLNGDNIYYHILGEALATGQGYVDISNPMTPVHNHYPPGYPFIISIFMRLGFEEISFFNACIFSIANVFDKASRRLTFTRFTLTPSILLVCLKRITMDAKTIFTTIFCFI